MSREMTILLGVGAIALVGGLAYYFAKKQNETADGAIITNPGGSSGNTGASNQTSGSSQTSGGGLTAQVSPQALARPTSMSAAFAPAALPQATPMPTLDPNTGNAIIGQKAARKHAA